MVIWRGHMVKDYSNSEIGNPLPPLLGLLFTISSKESFICTIPVLFFFSFLLVVRIVVVFQVVVLHFLSFFFFLIYYVCVRVCVCVCLFVTFIWRGNVILVSVRSYFPMSLYTVFRVNAWPTYLTSEMQY